MITTSVVRTPSTGSVTSCNPQSSESDAVHDHIRLRQRQIGAITRIGVHVRTGHVQHAGTTRRRKTVGSSSCGSKFSTVRCSAEMISDGRSDSDRQVLIKCIG
jgi:hypothetical protein